MMLCKLETSLHDPNGICHGSSDNTCNGGSTKVDIGVLYAIVEVIGNNLFAITVGEEVDGTSGDDANQCRPKTFEQRSC